MQKVTRSCTIQEMTTFYAKCAIQHSHAQGDIALQHVAAAKKREDFNPLQTSDVGHREGRGMGKVGGGGAR